MDRPEPINPHQQKSAFWQPPRCEQRGERVATFRPPPCREEREQRYCLPAAASCGRRAASSAGQRADTAFRPLSFREEGEQCRHLPGVAAPRGARRRISPSPSGIQRAASSRGSTPQPSGRRHAARSRNRASALPPPHCAVAAPRAAQGSALPLPSGRCSAARSGSSVATFRLPPCREELCAACYAASSAGERAAGAFRPPPRCKEQSSSAALRPPPRREQRGGACRRRLPAANAPRGAGAAPPPSGHRSDARSAGERVAAAFWQTPHREQRGKRAATYRLPPCREKREQSRCLPAPASCRCRAASSAGECAAAFRKPPR